jgi:DNA-directed RNA polymerase specialized sigma24 family protein
MGETHDEDARLAEQEELLAHADTLYGYALARIGHPEAAEDLLKRKARVSRQV